MFNRAPIATHPELNRIRIAFWVGVAFFLFALISGISGIMQTMYPFSILRLPLPDLGTAIVLACIFGPFTLWRLVSLRFWLLVEKRRSASVAGDRRWLAVTQPDPLQAALSVPQAITLRFKRAHIWFWSVCGLLVAFLGPQDMFLISRNDLFIFLLPMLGFIALIVLVLSGVIISQSFLARYTVEIKDIGLEVRWESGKGSIWRKSSIRWEEARLFACYKLPIFLGYEIVMYELSSVNEVVFWYSLSRPQSLLTVWKPLLSTENYDRQMQALITLIAEKTGLSLYDLS